MRGTLAENLLIGLMVGIIPAYAGNTLVMAGHLLASRDHPRVCGEHDFFNPVLDAHSGSSPRMRGTPGPMTAIPRSGGNPRVCGEHVAVRGRVAVLQGSSPRMRGTLFDFCVVGQHDGIIPAYAGNTCTVHHRWPEHGDHPRVCGEHRFRHEHDPRPEGSSPRMRGTLFNVHEIRGGDGIIPAYAGNTMSLKNVSLRCWDHPRVCGEHPGVRG